MAEKLLPTTMVGSYPVNSLHAQLPNKSYFPWYKEPKSYARSFKFSLLIEITEGACKFSS